MLKNPAFRLPVGAAGYLSATAGIVAGSVALSPLRADLDLSNLALLYVLGVVATAVRFGRGPAVGAALLGSLCFAYFFVPPHFSLAITEAQYLLSAVIMLAVAVMVGHMTSRLKQHADDAERKSVESARLYDLARNLAGASTREQVLAFAETFLESSLGARAVRVVNVEELGGDSAPLPSYRIAECIDQNRIITRIVAPGVLRAYLPLRAASGLQGVATFLTEIDISLEKRVVEYLETAASVLAVALERSHFVARASETEIQHAAEALRNSILSALSHDLRTPLTALVGMAETLAHGRLSDERQRYLVEAVRNQSMLISQQMTQLLDMARLSSGPHQFDMAWQPVEEVLEATIRLVRGQWKDREISVDVEPGLPPIRIDAVLIERVLWNLLENAIKYSSAEAPIEVTARRAGDQVEIAVCDAGPGLPGPDPERLFERFRRGRSESDIPGLGLGLSIARTIVEAHGGTIRAENRFGGGSCFRVLLPVGVLPDFDELEESA